MGGRIFPHHSGPSVRKVICFQGQLRRGLRVIDSSEITPLHRILMDGFLCCLTVGFTEIFHESINLQGPES